AEAPGQAGAGRAADAEQGNAEPASGDRGGGACRQDRHGSERVRKRRCIFALERLEVAPVEYDLVAARRLGVEHATEEMILPRPPLLPWAASVPATDPAQQRRGSWIV